MAYLNELEMNPFSRKGHIATNNLIQIIKENGVKDTEKIEEELFNESAFFDNFYVKPLTRYCSDELNISQEDDINYQKSKEILSMKFCNFEKNLNSNVTNIFWLYGPAGCGKTTYLYDLKRRFKENNTTINDFEDIERKVVLKYENKKIEIGDQKLWRKHNCYKFCLLVIDGIFKTLKLEESFKTKDYIFLNNIISHFSKLDEKLILPDETKKFWEYLSRLVNNTDESNLMEFISFFSSLIDEETMFNVSDDNVCEPIYSLINVISYLLVCTGNINKKREIFVFDNIEYYIRVLVNQAGKRIPDRTIEIIIQSVITALEDQVGGFLNNQIKYVPCFIVVTRPATATFNQNGQVNNQYAIDITKWFWAKEIYEKKINYINKYVGENYQKLYNLFLKLLEDCTNSSWSLGIFLPRLFNYDYRRLCRITLDSLKVGFLYSSYKFSDNYSRFLEIWEKAKLPVNTNSGIRHLCRIFIIRMVLDEFNKINQFEKGNTGESLFKCLKFDCNKDYHKLTLDKVKKIINDKSHYQENQYSSYVRKVLTILHRYEIESTENQIQIVNYMSFEELLKEMFLCGGCANVNNIKTEWLANLSSILYIMNEYSDKANWGQLTTIKWNFDGQNYSSDRLLKILCKAKENIISGNINDCFGIKINPAGQAFLKLLPEFEFFDLRYCEDLPSLFTDDGMKMGKGGWKAEQIIDRVLWNSLYCCNEVITRDYDFFSCYMEDRVDFNLLYSSKFIYHETATNYSNISHPLRIIKQQANYLTMYREFVSQLESNENRFKNDEEKNALLTMLDSKIELYAFCEREYKRVYPEYFNCRRE